MRHFLKPTKPGSCKIGLPSLREAVQPLAVGDELVLPWDKSTCSYVDKLALETDWRLHYTHEPGATFFIIYRTSAIESLEVEAVNAPFVYYAPKSKQLLPLHFFRFLNLKEVYAQVDDSRLVKRTDFPGIKHGFCHNEVFSEDGSPNITELDRLEKLWDELYNKVTS